MFSALQNISRFVIMMINALIRVTFRVALVWRRTIGFIVLAATYSKIGFRPSLTSCRPDP